MRDQLELTCTNFLKLALSRRLSIFHRLVYLAGMHDETTGRYWDDTLSAMFGDGEVDRVVRAHHKQTFSAWLGLNPEQQTAELARYVQASAADGRAAPGEWITGKRYEKLIPSEAAGPERLLFVSDLEVVVALMRGRPESGQPALPASPAPQARPEKGNSGG